MTEVWLCTITKGGVPVYQFVTSSSRDHAGYLAGAVMDALCDYHGGDDWYYDTEAAPYAGAMTAVNDLRQHALSKAFT